MLMARYIVVVGGSYVGVNTAQRLADAFAGRMPVVLIEKNSHFQHLFAFPRYAVTADVDTHKAFIPYIGTFAKCTPGSGTTVQAKVLGLDKDTIHLDREVSLDGQTVNKIPYAYLVVATGTKLSPPSSLPGTEKLDGYTYLRKHAQKVKRSSNIAVLGGGAVGVQMATDIKELYPEKSVTLLHSRLNLMNHFDSRLSDIVVARCHELGIKLKLGSRVKIPVQGYPTDGSPFEVNLEDGSSVSADFAIICTGQTPQSSLIQSVAPQSIDEKGFIKTLKSLQIDDQDHPNIFAVGDVAATGAHKAAKP
ncbi:vacuolar protein sorting/targeting protein PEP1 [Elasticomyces elasticus]|uniref:FAD/NAD(P)-binding domain-containing protein n=1 Tax=Exophiala sideris TaxID=1016849 RepID=A0ABR0J323_9EURO|nr:vacuolar protein sorting/targeting protein PEP1 [Elasticomyces elasticus]KAK5024336.1 hypothetical protein LTS07_008627 [Exophiala sideris]KAK5030982.1 vacuolar protein sorting/targeting protein PEP1 [Exophiala sideris]KAK5054069.1 hypothetical protein LTR69_009031 [Exophiala sideris]KAK5179575.1 hypothetical protein LTR44_008091 [Eurotiomycetes sp. CCFEE 6388]